MKRLLLSVPQLLLLGLVWGQDCTADDGTEGVELWGECYSIENTDTLDLGYNQLTGSIPSEIGNLTNLTSLYLNNNQLTGSIPSEIGNLTNLTFLNLSSNQLTGSISSEIGNLTNLKRLYLSGNYLSGSIPMEIGNLTNLIYLFLSSNEFSGEIPVGIGNLTNLGELYLQNNQLTGGIPEQIGNLTNLYSLYLFNNQLVGELPTEISNLDLIFLKLNNNQFSGPILDELCDIYFLDVSDNQFCPPYPECISEDDLGYQNTTNCSSESISESTLPTQYTLHQPFPNPFNPTTTLSFSIPEQSQTSLKVYDIKGNLISTLLNQTMNVGHHQIEWNGENLSSGTYFIRINSGEFSDVKKVVLVK